VPIPREAGHLSDADIRLERRSGGTWQRLAVHPGCDPVYSAALGEPFDLEAGGSRTLHLRIRLADSPATIPHPAQYYLGAGPAGNPDALSILSENFLIRPRQNSGTGPAGRPAPTHGDGPASAATAAAAYPAAPTPPAAAPASLPHTGPPIWPLAGGIALLLGGTGALVAARRRHMGRR
jgi:LPXTG-motif cell wall-anchored protein